jgi:hypothetical protein
MGEGVLNTLNEIENSLNTLMNTENYYDDRSVKLLKEGLQNLKDYTEDKNLLQAIKGSIKAIEFLHDDEDNLWEVWLNLDSFLFLLKKAINSKDLKGESIDSAIKLLKRVELIAYEEAFC